MKININVHLDDAGRYVAYDPDGILKGKTFAYSLKTLKEVNLPELKQISIKIYNDEGIPIPSQIIDFEGFNIINI